jgi:hypothetical protein
MKKDGSKEDNNRDELVEESDRKDDESTTTTKDVDEQGQLEEQSIEEQPEH